MAGATRQRVHRLMRSAIESFGLDLCGMTVLTEAGSGYFALTPVIAALAGADRVIAVTRDSRYGTAQDIAKDVAVWQSDCDLTATAITVSTEPPMTHAAEAHLITNLGFVRPIDAAFISKLPEDAAVALMWETWEFRPEDIDRQACEQSGVPIMGTDELDPRLQIFRYVGMLGLKLLLEAGIEAVNSRILIVGAPPFGEDITQTLRANGAETLHYHLGSAVSCDQVREFCADVDAIIYAEHHSRKDLLTPEHGIDFSVLARAGAPVIHICGALDVGIFTEAGVVKYPCDVVSPGYMTRTTDYVGPKPVVRLHAAGLAVGAAMVRGRRQGLSGAALEDFAFAHSPAMNFAGRRASSGSVQAVNQ